MIQLLLARILFASLFHLEYIVKSLSQKCLQFPICLWKNISQHSAPPKPASPSPGPSLLRLLALIASHGLLALCMPNAFPGPDLETILILFMFHLLACSDFRTILQSSQSYSSFKLHLSYYYHYLFILMRPFLNGPPTPLSVLLLLCPNSLHPPVCWHHSTSIQDDVQIIEASYCLTAHDLECL